MAQKHSSKESQKVHAGNEVNCHLFRDAHKTHKYIVRVKC
jgi:hypothetical protein